MNEVIFCNYLYDDTTANILSIIIMIIIISFAISRYIFSSSQHQKAYIIFGNDISINQPIFFVTTVNWTAVQWRQ